jgi:thymidine kinase
MKLSYLDKEFIMQEKKGTLEVVCGSMFSGKSEELIRRVKRSQLAKRNVIVFKHSLDDRTTTEYVVSHNGNRFEAIPIENPSTILAVAEKDIDVVGVDEIQFFRQEIIEVICTLVDAGKRVIVAGLDLDFRGVPFGPMPTLMAIADNVTKLKAICMICGAEAHFTQRLVNGKPAQFDDPTILVGAQEKYQARCRNCHAIDQSPRTAEEFSQL